MNIKLFNKHITNPIKRWEPLGVDVDVYGTKRVGRLISDVPYGYLHEMYAPADTNSISKYEEYLGRDLPKQYKDFLLITNGANFFNPIGFSVFGIIQDNYLDDYKAYPWRFPMDINKNNDYSWLKLISDNAIVLGRNDGASCYLVHTGQRGSIIEYDPNEPDEFTFEWKNFDEWLISEFSELFIQHDDKGNLLLIEGGEN